MSWLKNWKTTLVGLGVGGVNLYASGLDWKHVLVSVGMVAMGVLAKDFNVTGGTPPQLPPAQ